ncbi:MAG: Fur family transcriptional regulator [Minisyncoccia bacterium]
MIDETLQTLKEQGYRITKTRKAVLEILVASAKPLSADDLIKCLSKKKLHPNKTTIYRELDSLSAGGFVKEIQLGFGRRMYEVTSLGHHHHLVCTSCEKVEDVSMENDMAIYEKSIMKKTSFKVSSHSLEFFGLCAGCQ